MLVGNCSMSLEGGDQMSLDNGSDNSNAVLMKEKICYSREFLLSLSNLDVCKKLPSGLEDSLKSEFEDVHVLLVMADRPRLPGSFVLQGLRRNDYSSSPPTRADSVGYSRGTYGKWENRSSGWSDRDSDSQSDRDSDSVRRYTYQSRRSWQSPEHDGLLGSGSFPRSSGYSTGTSTAKTRANEHNQLSRSNEPYHPPRPYKATTHSRRDTDAFNDETFGSIDSTSKDRAEEERRRRESFEMMRKGQQRVLQEKQKLILEKHKGGDVPDLCEGLANDKEEKGLLIKNNELVVSASPPIPISSNDSERPPSASQSLALRPLVPPGFKSNTLEKSFGLKSQIHPPLTEVEALGKTVSGDGLEDAEANIAQSAVGGLVKLQQPEEISLFDGQSAAKTRVKLLCQGEIVNVHGSSDGPIKKPFLEDQLDQLSSHLGSLTNHNASGVSELNTEILEDKTISNNSSTSILDKIFGSTLSFNDDKSSLAENLDNKPDDSWLPSSAQSSKFAQWFFEEEAKLPDDASSARPNNLLSWIANGDKANKESGQVCVSKKDEAFPAVLTCEDLEQSILSEYSSNTVKVEPILGCGSVAGANSEQSSAPVNDHASLHLLSMLQKSTGHSNMAINSGGDVNLAAKWSVPGEHDMVTTMNEPEGHGLPPNSGQTLTLETLFGSAFMKELQSVDAPISVKRGSIDNARLDTSEPPGLAFPMTDNGFSFPASDKSGLQRLNNDYGMPLNNRPDVKVSETDEWAGIGDFTIKTSPPNPHTLAVHKLLGPEKYAEFQLPEEDHFIALHNAKDYMVTGNSINDSHIPSSRPPINIPEKLAALDSVKESWGMDGSGNLPFSHDSYKQMEHEILHQNLQMQQHASLFHPPQMTQLNPLYAQLESFHPTHLSSQMNISSPENIFNHDLLANQQFSSGMIRPSFQHPNVRVSGFDVPSQHSMLHQVQMPGNRPPHLLPDFPRSTHVPRHVNQAAGFFPEVSQIQGFPFGPHQPNIGNRGNPLPGNPPEAFQRLIETELVANSKQMPHFAPSRSQGMYGHGVDMGFQYR